MVKVVIVVTDEDDADTPFVYSVEFPSMGDVHDWFGEAARFSDLNKVPHRMHPIGEGC